MTGTSPQKLIDACSVRVRRRTNRRVVQRRRVVKTILYTDQDIGFRFLVHKSIIGSRGSFDSHPFGYYVVLVGGLGLIVREMCAITVTSEPVCTVDFP